MLVDIHRNDLGRVARPGTVRVPNMMRIDRRRHVLQAVAEIRAELGEGKGPVDVIEAFLPAGCITGVPKVRCLQVLDELERWRRGPYTGSFGRIAAWGDLELNVLIRTAWKAAGHAAFQAGGGIVLDSDPESEWRESLAKVRSIDEAVRALAEPANE
jgi:para-aminobenzoate synthetase component 1